MGKHTTLPVARAASKGTDRLVILGQRGKLKQRLTFSSQTAHSGGWKLIFSGLMTFFHRQTGTTGVCEI